jgi:hypothetical protein
MKSSSPTVATYVENQSEAADLAPAPGPKLLFAAWFSHGPGFQENLRFFVGPSRCKRYDVLWQESDWSDEGISAIAWIPKGGLTGRTLWETLLTGCWNAEKAADFLPKKPLFDEVKFEEKSLLSSEEIWKIAERVWPC